MTDKGILKVEYLENPNDIVKQALMRQLKKLEEKAGFEDNELMGDKNGTKKTLAV